MNIVQMNDERIKTIEINGDMYQIQKFTARDGLKLARLVLAKIAPIIPLLSEDDKKQAVKAAKAGGKKSEETTTPNVDDQAVYSAVTVALDHLDDKDMDYLMDKCLRVCSKVLPAGPMPIIDENGYYGIPEAEYDMALTVRLIVEAIKWGAADFFGEKGLDLKALLNQIGK